MKPLSLSACLFAIGLLYGSFSASSANAQNFGGAGNFGFQPFGFYQPYGAHYGTSIRTPPYFATNPPVYYGTRYARPYGLSPFAAPPMVSAPASYVGREATQFVRPPANNPHIIEPCDNCTGTTATADDVVASAKQTHSTVGEVQINPFATETSRVAKR